MAVRAVALTRNADGSLLLAQWVGMSAGDVGEPIAFGEWGDRSVQVTGDFGTGGTLKWEGSNDRETFCSLTNSKGEPMEIITHCVAAVTEISVVARPRVTAGDGATNLSVHVLLRRPMGVSRVTQDNNFRSL